MASPDNIPIDGYDKVISVHGAVAVKPFVEKKPHHYQRHYQLRYPHLRVGEVFPIKVKNACDKAKYVKKSIQEMSFFRTSR